MADGTCIAFLAVARLQDQEILATCYDKNAVNEEKKAFELTLGTVVQRAKLSYPGWKDKVVVDEVDSVLHSMVDGQSLCIALVGIRGQQYPDRIAQNLLRDLLDKVRLTQNEQILSEARPMSLSMPLNKLMKDLIKAYSTPSNLDKTTEVREKVDQLKGIMQDNVKRILETHVTLESLESSSSSMSTQANKFLRQSTDLRKMIECRNLKLKILLVLCVLAIVLYFLIPLIKV